MCSYCVFSGYPSYAIYYNYLFVFLRLNVLNKTFCFIFAYFRGAQAHGSAAYGEGSGRIVIGELKCSGTEKDISECKSKTWGSETNCGHREDAAVKCGEFQSNIYSLPGQGPVYGAGDRRLELHETCYRSENGYDKPHSITHLQITPGQPAER